MSTAWGVDSSDIIQRVWIPAPAGEDGDTVESLTLRLPVEGEFAVYGDVGKRFDGTRAAGLILSPGQIANAERVATQGQYLIWAGGLAAYGPDVHRVGVLRLEASDQSNEIILGDTTTFSDEFAIKAYRNSRLGALDIRSPGEFADSAYAQRAITELTRATSWIDKTTAERLNLSAAADYGPFTVRRPFAEPTAWRT